jgi:hypothetical protein
MIIPEATIHRIRIRGTVMLQLRSKDRRNEAHLARRTRTVLVQKKVFGERAGAAAAILTSTHANA